MRAHSGDCITYEHTNLVPAVYEQDDFQIFTPTDIIGQHIHLADRARRQRGRQLANMVQRGGAGIDEQPRAGHQ